MSRRPRVALYGHDTCGLGHLRRNLALASAVVGEPAVVARPAGARGPAAGGREHPAGAPDVLLLSGAAAAGRFPRPRGVDVLVLPEVDKRPDGSYAAGSLGADLDDVVSLRSGVLTAALASWAPDLLVVDKVPRGFAGELEEALRMLRRRGGTRVVLGLRDVLDDPARARREWHEDGGDSAVRELYDEVWVYGDRRVHDLTADLRMPADLRVRTRFTGYLATGRVGAPRRPAQVPAGRRVVLGVAGGGQDGGRLAAAVAAAPLPAGTTAVLVAGPYCPPGRLAALQAAAARRDDLMVVPFCDDLAAWVAGADAVVTMGGYNSVAEVLATTTPALLVPRVTPRQEQLVRARALARLGAVDLLEPAAAEPAAVGRWVAAALAGRRRPRRDLDLGGLPWVARRTARLLPSPAPQPVPSLFAPSWEEQHRAAV
jgi:predicted glycosyltransferase